LLNLLPMLPQQALHIQHAGPRVVRIPRRMQPSVIPGGLDTHRWRPKQSPRSCRNLLSRGDGPVAVKGHGPFFVA
jgi:hypothetical protein